jgi:hypothetical protein
MQETRAERLLVAPPFFSLSLRERAGVRALGRTLAGASEAAGDTLTLPSPGGRGFFSIPGGRGFFSMNGRKALPRRCRLPGREGSVR